ncbi:MAG TPA: hypothetical protein VES20_07300 [Bryobacteraceae bacterium]|nr:hypothetical protein [Bryobacteraceae bacterium]
MRHLTIAADIRRHVAEEQYDEAQGLLSAFARAVTEECVHARDEVAFASAREFLQRTVVDLRARRAHLNTELSGLQRSRPYLTRNAEASHSVDCTG